MPSSGFFLQLRWGHGRLPDSACQPVTLMTERKDSRALPDPRGSANSCMLKMTAVSSDFLVANVDGEANHCGNASGRAIAWSRQRLHMPVGRYCQADCGPSEGAMPLCHSVRNTTCNYIMPQELAALLQEGWHSKTEAGVFLSLELLPCAYMPAFPFLDSALTL